jgi:hypothetical protein
MNTKFFISTTAHGLTHTARAESGDWSVDRLLNDQKINCLVTDPNEPGHLYAGLSNGNVWHTADYGNHWQQLPLNLASVACSMVMLP